MAFFPAFFTYLLTYSMEQSPLQANRLSASQEIPRLVWNQKVQYRIHKYLSSPPYVLHAPPISFFSILSPEQHWVRSTHHQALHYVFFSTPWLPRPT